MRISDGSSDVCSSDRIAWRKGLLVFNGQRLGDAAAEVNRYSDLRVTIDDPTLARAEFMGVFKLGDARAFANAAARAFHGDVHRRGTELVLVRHKNSPSTCSRISAGCPSFACGRTNLLRGIGAG